jgi:hypothetical protein
MTVPATRSAPVVTHGREAQPACLQRLASADEIVVDR